MSKQRNHKANRGGRPTNQKRLDAQRAEIKRLRQLISHRNHSDQTWQLIDRLVATLNELDELATPLRAATYDGVGHAADQPIFPGVALADDGAGIDNPDGDGSTNRGDRNLYHGGKYADHLAGWLHRQITWSLTTIDRRLRGREEDPKPQPPRKNPQLSQRAETPIGTESDRSLTNRIESGNH